MKKPLEIDYYGETITLGELSRRTGIHKATLQYRYTSGYRGELLWAQNYAKYQDDETVKKRTEKHLEELKKKYIGKMYGELEIIDISIGKVDYAKTRNIAYAKTRCIKCGDIHTSKLNHLVSSGVSHCTECLRKEERNCIKLAREICPEDTNLLTLKKTIQGTRKMNKNNKTNHTGVYKRGNGRYLASIRFQGKNIHLGVFDDINDAIDARKDAEKKYFGTFLERYKREHPDKWEVLEKIDKSK